MEDWEKLTATLLPEKEDFCRHLNMENIIDADYTETKRVSKDSRKILQNIKICFFKVIHCC